MDKYVLFIAMHQEHVVVQDRGSNFRSNLVQFWGSWCQLYQHHFESCEIQDGIYPKKVVLTPFQVVSKWSKQITEST